MGAGQPVLPRCETGPWVAEGHTRGHPQARTSVGWQDKWGPSCPTQTVGSACHRKASSLGLPTHPASRLSPALGWPAVGPVSLLPAFHDGHRTSLGGGAGPSSTKCPLCPSWSLFQQLPLKGRRLSCWRAGSTLRTTKMETHSLMSTHPHPCWLFLPCTAEPRVWVTMVPCPPTLTAMQSGFRPASPPADSKMASRGRPLVGSPPGQPVDQSRLFWEHLSRFRGSSPLGLSLNFPSSSN